MAAKTVTATIPIVFVTDFDPIVAGLVESFNEPDGNATGIYVTTNGLEAKRLELLHELVPNVSVIGYLVNPANPMADIMMQEMQDAARGLGQQLQFAFAGSGRDFDNAYTILVEHGVRALVVSADPLFRCHSDQLVALAAKHALPAIYASRRFVDAGGLVSYGANFVAAFRQGGLYTGRILNGEKPGDMPVVQATKYKFFINLKTAKALGLTIPSALLATTDQVSD
jgi:putative ABC transport system substrate-binding protein